MIPPATVTSGANLMARLTPLKRILCLCPVVAGTSSDSHQGACHIGIAVSDPYLARASPILLDNTETEPLEVYWHSCNSSPMHTFPKTSTELMNVLDYNDIGAIALALPMKQKKHTPNQQQSSQEQWVQATRTYLVQNILKDYWSANFGGGGGDGGDSKNGLVCYIEERLSLDEALEMAHQDPDMWEDIQELFPEQTQNAIHPSLHAAVALNQFLWHHTGGWQNTFG